MYKQLLILMSAMLIASAATVAMASGNEAAKGGKVTIVVTHEVKSYTEWRSAFN